MTKVDLREVTICAVSSDYPHLSLNSILRSSENCNFARALLFTDAPIPSHLNCEIVRINKITTLDEYSLFLLKNLHAYIDTKHVLIVQWDSFVTDPYAWNPKFLEYDYIGAKWEWHKDGKSVGNGGFSLRSKKLLETTALDFFNPIPNEPEDVQICRTYHNFLTNNHGIIFSDESTADAFSYERSTPLFPSFGFHGLFNIWRHLNDIEVLELLGELTHRTITSREYIELMLQYFNLRKFSVLEAMYKKITLFLDANEFNKLVSILTGDKNFADFFLQLCENLLKKKEGFPIP